MKGGAAFRLRSLVATDETTNSAPSRSRRTCFDCSSLVTLMVSSRRLTSFASNSGGADPASVANRCQYSSGTKRADLLLAVADQLEGHGLDASRAQPAPDLIPQQGADLVADEPIEHAASLLSIDHLHVDLGRVVQRFLNRLLRDLVEHQAPDFLLLRAQLFGQMPPDRFAFAVRVGCDVNVGRLFRGALQLRDNLLSCSDWLVGGSEPFVDVDTELALRQIADVSHRREHLVVASEILVDCLCLRRRFDDDERFCHGNLSNTLARATPADLAQGPKRTNRPPSTRRSAPASSNSTNRGNNRNRSMPERCAISSRS